MEYNLQSTTPGTLVPTQQLVTIDSFLQFLHPQRESHSEWLGIMTEVKSMIEEEYERIQQQLQAESHSEWLKEQALHSTQAAVSLQTMESDPQALGTLLQPEVEYESAQEATNNDKEHYGMLTLADLSLGDVKLPEEGVNLGLSQAISVDTLTSSSYSTSFRTDRGISPFSLPAPSTVGQGTPFSYLLGPGHTWSGSPWVQAADQARALTEGKG